MLAQYLREPKLSAPEQHLAARDVRRHRASARTRLPGRGRTLHERGHHRVGELDDAAALLRLHDDRVELVADPRAQQCRLDRVERLRLELVGLAVGRRHEVRQLRQCLAHPLRHLAPEAQRLARDEHEAIDQPAQRRGRVGVRRGDRGLRRVVGQVAVERGVARAAEQRRRRVDDREVLRLASGRACAGTRRTAGRAPTARRARRPGGGSARSSPRRARASCAGCPPCRRA